MNEGQEIWRGRTRSWRVTVQELFLGREAMGVRNEFVIFYLKQ
jgi:hypothetical protein